ncbi:MAG: cyclodeaminase/cyclohydrolase family protein [Lachnospiraceae bacterium]|nr:cyclodeaminase/cyclohydrolase family protein [Lachnospiraceae bacterium]
MTLDKMQVDDFIELLGSSEPAPGGGGAAALMAATGAALSEMVCSITIKNKNFEWAVESVTELQSRFKSYEKKFLAGMEEDREAFLQVSRAYKLPAGTDEEKAAKKTAIAESLKIGVKPPAKLMQTAFEAMKFTEALLGMTAPSVVSDIGVAACSLHSAIKSAWLNVLINLKGFEDEESAKLYRTACEYYLKESEITCAEIMEKVEAAM